MELWIRSQDKTFLRKVNTIGIVKGNDSWWIAENITIVLGKYKSKERALEIMDEIQNILQPVVFFKEPTINVNNGDSIIQTLSQDITISAPQQTEFEFKQAGQFVYQMPER